MKISFPKFVFPLAVLALVAGVSGCEENTDAVIRITVVENVIDPVSQQTVVEPVAQALVRFYQNETDSTATEWLDKTVTTSASGVAEYVFENPALLKYDVSEGGRISRGNNILLEQGETVEETVNLDEL
jgi:hypothetical protein